MSAKKTTASFRLSYDEKDEISNYTSSNSIGLRDLVLQSVRQEVNTSNGEIEKLNGEIKKYYGNWKKYYDHPLFKEVRENGIVVFGEDGGKIEITSTQQMMDYVYNEFIAVVR